MSIEERIAALEREVGELRAAFKDYARVHQEIGGSDSMYQAAVLALVASHPDPASLGPALAHQLASVDANIVGTSNTEERLQGAQEAQELVNLALTHAQEMRSRAATKE